MSDVFDAHVFSLSDARRELADFKRLLDGNNTLREREQVLAGFDRWPNLCVLFGIFHGKVRTGDLIRREFPVPNRLRADLAVTRAGSACFCLVEFEGATPDCIFRSSPKRISSKGKTKRPRQVAEWAEAFEKGFSQIVDWAWAIDMHRQDKEMVDAFGTDRPDCVGVLVIGRNSAISGATAKDRWDWRAKHVKASNWPVYLFTYDDLHEEFAVELTVREEDAARTNTPDPTSP